MTLTVGSCFHREHDPARVIEQAQAAEQAGYGEFWVIEDCFFTAGVSLAAAALATTSDIGVGIGILPTVARNPAITAMELATLAGLGPGRFHAGLGHGVQEWMAQMNEQRNSPLTMLSETLGAVRRLLAGEEVTIEGRYVTLDQVALEVPPAIVPVVSAGVRGPRSLEISGRRADGTILADFVSPTYVKWTREQVDSGVQQRDGDPADGPAPIEGHHRITVFATMAIGPDGAEMRQAVAPLLAEVCAGSPTSLEQAPFWPELSAQAEATSWHDAIAAMPADWWHQIAAVGTPDDAAAYLESLDAAGADAVAFFPNPDDPITSLAAAAPHLL